MATTQNISSKLFTPKEFFPIVVEISEKETIKIDKRPRKVSVDIIDIFSNDIHIGMFVGIENLGEVLKFGPAGLNKSHVFRGILNYTFIRLLEYYGLANVKSVVIAIPEDLEFKMFLTRLGFKQKRDQYVLDISDDEQKNKFIDLLDKNFPEIRSQKGQIHELIRLNNDGAKPEKIDEMTEVIAEKIRNMKPLDEDFWANRLIAEINNYVAIAVLYASKLEREEFLENTIKTIVGTFDTYVRDAYLEELFLALEGRKTFTMGHIQKIVNTLRDLLSEEIKNLDKDKLRKWVYDNMEMWKLNDKIHEETRERIIRESMLKLSDFGGTIKETYKPYIESLIDHYNGTNIFFGLPREL